MKTGDLVTTRSGKTGRIVALADGYLADVQIVCHLTDVAQTPHRYGRKPVDRRPIDVLARYHRDDVTLVPQSPEE